MKIKLIENWRQAHTFASVRIAAGGALLMALEFLAQSWNFVPFYLQSKIPFGEIIATGFFIATICGRLMAPKPKEKCDDNGRSEHIH